MKLTLVELLARELPEWPEGCRYAIQGYQEDSKMVFFCGCGNGFDREFSVQAIDAGLASVTFAQWEAERARILAESQPERDADIAKVVDAGKCRNKEDQALWDQAANKLFTAFVSPDDLPSTIFKYVSISMDMADAFMAERAKRLKP